MKLTNLRKTKKLDLVLLLQPTTSFRELSKFYKANNILKKQKSIDSGITVNNVKNYHPYRMKLIKKNFNEFCKIKRKFQDIKKLIKVYIRTGSMYFLRRKSKKNSIVVIKFMVLQQVVNILSTLMNMRT